MQTQFALDLRVARRKAGLTQRDCAHLLAIHTSRLSNLEHGSYLPSLPEICELSLIFGRSFESLFAQTFADARIRLKERILTLPKDTRSYVGTMNRENTIEQLAIRLAEETSDHDRA